MHNPRPSRPPRIPIPPVLALALLAVLLYAGCQTQPTTNAPTAQNTATSTATPTPELSPTVEITTKNFDNDDDAKNYMDNDGKKEADERHKRDVGHDEPIIISDGSLHILLSDTSTFKSVFKPDPPAGAELTSIGTGRIWLLYVAHHPSNPNNVEVIKYKFIGKTHADMVVDYGNTDGFLTLTTMAGDDHLHVKVPKEETAADFSKWTQKPDATNVHELVWEPNNHLGGHRKVTVHSDYLTKPGEHPETANVRKTRSALHYWVY